MSEEIKTVKDFAYNELKEFCEEMKTAVKGTSLNRSWRRRLSCGAILNENYESYHEKHPYTKRFAPVPPPEEIRDKCDAKYDEFKETPEFKEACQQLNYERIKACVEKFREDLKHMSSTVVEVYTLILISAVPKAAGFSMS